jgi:hypothetical protein
VVAVAALASLTAIASSATSKPATVKTGTSSLGRIVVDGQSHTLYLFQKDKGAKSACSGACAQNWPPLLTKGAPALSYTLFTEITPPPGQTGGLINAIFAKNFDQVNWIPAFVLTPLTYFGGVFYSVELLPQWAQKISMVNPILHMVNAFRYGFLGKSDVSVAGAFAIMTVLVVALYAWALVLLNRGSGTRD